jgi:hypothetical protein
MTNLPLIALATSIIIGSDGLPVPQNAPKLSSTPVEKELTPVTCVGCTDVEQKTAEFFYKKGVKDRQALAVVLGNIRQESGFNPQACEGHGIRTSIPYQSCRRGGFGLIQFTSSHRYYGLGNYARSIGKTPEQLETQLEYITTEREWKAASRTFTTPGLHISNYDRAAYTWLGWGIKGARMTYAWQYINRIVTT